ncbi:TadE/TadG family type IV pilus assembly protein [Ilumatobacter sp.]|uniref:TadE/TadG family type IV pilus assembly protein n=1 Tax=Ilumatobacter sp. TaxID=1967498 RepID=UPI003B518054
MNPTAPTTRRDDRGVVALEMVMALPILVMLIVGVVVLGNALSVKTQTVGLARDGARAAALGQPLPAGTSITSASCPSPSDPTRSVTVTATRPLVLRSVPFLPALLPSSLSETVTMRCGA